MTQQNEQLNTRPRRLVTAAERRERVYRLKLAGGSDREIQAVLAADPVSPTKVSHVTVNNDWHLVAAERADDVAKETAQQRALAIGRYERLLAAVWPRATQANPSLGAVGEARALIKEQRALLGLDAPELGDAERPIHVEERVTVDYTTLSDDELLTLRDIARRQPNVINGVGHVVA